MFTKAAVAASLVAAVSAHQNWHQFWVNGVTPGYQVGIRMPPSNSPVTNVTSKDIACNVNGSNVPSGVDTVPATAGDTIEVQWDSSTHPGPITHFLYGPVDDASMTTGIGAGWVKINEFDEDNGTWASAIMDAQNMTYSFKLPADLESGEYLLRSEMLALHGSETLGGAQFYIGCGQLKITGPGGSCAPSIALPGAYNENDTDIYIPDFYYGFNISTYSAPGGAVATCGSGSQATKLASTTAISTSAPVVPTETSVSVAASASASSSPVVTSTPIVTPSSSALTASVIVPTSTDAAASSIISAFSSLTSDLPSSVLTEAAPTATATSGTSSTISTAGMTISELLDLVKQILTQLVSSNSSSKARRHARDVVA